MSWFTRKNRPYQQFYNENNLSSSTRIKTNTGTVALPEKIVQQAKNVAMPFCRRPPTLDFSESIDRLADPRTSDEEKKQIIDELVLLRLIVSRDLVAETRSPAGLTKNLIPKSWSQMTRFEQFVQVLEASVVCSALASTVSTTAELGGVAGNVLAAVQQAQTAAGNAASTKNAVNRLTQARELGAKVGEIIVVKAASEVSALGTGISLLPVIKLLRQRFTSKTKAELVEFLDSLLTEFPGVPEILFSPEYTISSFAASKQAQQILQRYIESLRDRLPPTPIRMENFLKQRRSRRRNRRSKQSRV